MVKIIVTLSLSSSFGLVELDLRFTLKVKLNDGKINHKSLEYNNVGIFRNKVASTSVYIHSDAVTIFSMWGEYLLKAPEDVLR